MKFAIITGAGTGIGKATAHKLADSGCEVLGIGRRIEKLREMQKKDPNKINVLAADLREYNDRKKVLNYVKDNNKKINFLVHNAGVLSPVKKIVGVSLKEFKDNLATNLEAPLFLTIELLPEILSGGRILHVSSGAAHKVIPHWGTYCIAKSALFMLYQVFKEELVDTDITVGSFSPGIVDTPMQEMIRSLSNDEFPQTEIFRAYKERGMLSPPEKIADCIKWLLLQSTDKAFTEKEWEPKEILEKYIGNNK